MSWDRPQSWTWTLAAAVAVLAVSSYANSLQGALLYDDTNAIVRNAWVQKGDPLAIVTHPSWWSEGRGRGWRPVATLSFALDYALHGLEPVGYHVTNVALHAGVSVLVLAVFARVTGGLVASTIAGLLFAAHPVHTEAVASVVGRAELLAAGGFFLAWLLFLRADHTARGRGALDAIGIAVFFSALLAKENALALLPVLIVTDLLYPGADTMATLRAHTRRYVALAVAALVFIILRHVVLGPDAPGIERLDNPLIALPPLERYLTAVKVAGIYGWRLLVPITLAADYSYRQIEPVSSPLAPDFLAGLALVLGVPLLAWRTRRRAPAVALGCAFLVFTFAMVSNLLFPIGTIMAERLIYLPSAGFCLLLAAALVYVVAPRLTLTDPRLAVPILAIVALYGARTWSRNRTWRDPLVFFSTMVAEAPRSARSHRELGNVLADAGHFDEAQREFERSLAIKPADPATLYNLGNAALQAQRIDAAIDAYTHALEAKPDFVDAMVNLGNAESMRGDQQAALVWMRRALVVTPGAPSIHMNIANTLFRLEDYEEARREYQAALALDPDAPDILTNYGSFLYSRGEYDAAISAYERAARAPTPMALVGLAAAYRAKGMPAEARSVQVRAERLFPGNGAVRQMGDVLRRDTSGQQAGS